MKKILVHEPTGEKNEFLKEINKIKDKCNSLITIFQKYQNFKKIKDLKDFDELCLSPATYFDKTLLSNVSFPLGSYEINVERLAELVNVDRCGYLSAIGYDIESDEDCPGCRSKVSIKKGPAAIDYHTYKKHSQYLLFSEGSFILNHDTINVKLQSFSVYAENEKQIQFVQYWQDVLNVLESQFSIELLGPSKLSQICDLFGMVKMIDNKLYLNDDRIANEVLKLK